MNVELRPAAAVGHVFLRASNVRRASERLESIGLRPIMVRDAIAVIEMRGGTHIVVRKQAPDDSFEADFDLMYDDLEAAREQLTRAGFETGPISSGGIHSQFHARAPEGFELDVVSSHAGRRAV